MSLVNAFCPMYLHLSHPEFPDTIMRKWRMSGSFDDSMRARCHVVPIFTWRHAPYVAVRRARTVTLLRPPSARMRSAFKYRMHGLAWNDPRTRELILRSADPFFFFTLHACGWQARMLASVSGIGPTSGYTKPKLYDLTENDTTYGSWGAYRRGLSVLKAPWPQQRRRLLELNVTKSDRTSDGTQRLLRLATRQLDTFWFIGFTDHWAETVHRFHATLGIPCLFGHFTQLKDTRVRSITHSNQGYEFHDWLDQAVYDYARTVIRT